MRASMLILLALMAASSVSAQTAAFDARSGLLFRPAPGPIMRSLDGSAIRPETVTLRRLQSQTPPQRSWVRRHPALTGFLIGAGIGAGLAQRLRIVETTRIQMPTAVWPSWHSVGWAAARERLLAGP